MVTAQREHEIIMTKTKTKLAIEPRALRCRYCYSELTNPTCEKCYPVRLKMSQIAGAAHYIFGIKGTIFERGIFERKSEPEKAKV